MSHHLIRTWLQLPPEAPWPPDHYTLLGLAPGCGGTDEIEQRVLERMDLLRRYQLLHPEQVTEAMNRLAQAMICLTDPDARRAYDVEQGFAPASPPRRREPGPAEKESTLPTTLELVPEDDEAPYVAELDVPPPSRRTVVSRPTALAEPTLPPGIEEPLPEEDGPLTEEEVRDEAILDVIILPDEPARRTRPPARRTTRPAPPPPPPHKPLDLPEEDRPAPPPLKKSQPAIKLPQEPLSLDEAAPARRAADPHRAERRALYGQIARIRKVLRVWERVRVFFDDPERSLARRTDALALMGHLAELRPLLPTVADLVGGPDQPGTLVAMLARQQPVVDTFRSLLPGQIDSFAKDCRAGHFRLSYRMKQLRADVRRRLPWSFGRRVWSPLVRHVARRPEWVLLPLGASALLIALFRSVPE